MAVHYLEIVSNDVESLTGVYQRMHGLSFGPPDPDLGQARIATQGDGALVGVRKPVAAHEQPIIRTYLAVENIEQAVKKAEDSGATIAYPPTRQGNRGTFAIVIQGDVEHGLWQGTWSFRRSHVRKRASLSGESVACSPLRQCWEDKSSCVDG